MPGTLYIIGTPIGNLDDASPRMRATLESLSLLMCEDTRVTAKLLARFDIRIPLDSYREEVHHVKMRHVIATLAEGKDVGLVSDAGTPAISDPGARLVSDALAALPDLKVVPVPGPSAVAAALSVSGFRADSFVFLGFPPHKKGRASWFKEAMEERRTAVLYESPHRIMKALDALAAEDPERRLCVCRELTKLHETVYRGIATEIMAALEKGSSKGEFVIVIDAKR